MTTNIYTAVQEIMLKLKDSLTLRKIEAQSVAAQAKRLAAAGAGENIEEHDFSYLRKGMYFIEIGNSMLKLIKE